MHATSSKKQLAKMFRIKSQTKSKSSSSSPPPPEQSSSQSKPKTSSSDDHIAAGSRNIKNDVDGDDRGGAATGKKKEGKTSWTQRLDERWNRKIRPVIERMNGVM